jgi:ABC-type multidrug transport system ATPase subunit
MQNEGTGDSVVKVNIQNTCEGARATPVHLEWAKVCFEAKQSGVAKKVLQDCNGMAKPGDITAIMGPSGEHPS